MKRGKLYAMPASQQTTNLESMSGFMPDRDPACRRKLTESISVTPTEGVNEIDSVSLRLQAGSVGHEAPH